MALLIALPALAADWAATLEPGATGSYLDRTPAKVLVAAGGEGAGTRQAAEALESALRRSNRTSLVMNDQAIGRIATSTDAEIVRKARGLPVELIAVVRISTTSGEDAETLVVTFYDPAGKAISTLTGSPGRAIQPREVAAADARATGSPAPSEAKRSYEERFIGFQDGAWVNHSRRRIVSTYTDAYQGSRKRHLSPTEFYELVGREDLASRYRLWTQVKWWTLVGGAVATTAGTVTVVTSLPYSCVRESVSGDCAERDYRTAVYGAVAGGLGLVALGWAISISEHPVDPSTRRRLADEYNQRLEGESGRSGARPRSQSVRFAIAASLGPRAAGAVILGEF